MKAVVLFIWCLFGGEVAAQNRLVDCTRPMDGLISDLESGPQLGLYLCVHERQDAGSNLVGRIADDVEDEGARNRLSRGLAVWLLGQVDRAFTGEEIRSLNSSDRNFLRVGIRARRGKESSCTVLELESKECPHGEVLEQFEWYRPQSAYSDRLLTEMDWANLEMIKNPPPAPETEEAQGPTEELAPGEPVAGSGGCGCASGGSQRLGWVVLLPFLTLLRRRL